MILIVFILLYGAFVVHLFLNPCHQNRDGIALFGFCEMPSGWYMVPFGEASAATATGGVLRQKHGMPAHGCLSAVVGNHGGSQTLGYEVASMPAYGVESLFADVVQVLGGQAELHAELRFREAFKQVGEVVRLFSRFAARALRLFFLREQG